MHPFSPATDSLKMFQNGWIPVRIRLEPRMMEINAEQQSKRNLARSVAKRPRLRLKRHPVQQQSGAWQQND